MLSFVILSTSVIFTVISSVSLPKRSLGFYCLIADDGEDGYHDTDNWMPQLYDYQVQSANVIWLTFINPLNMSVPPIAMANLAKCRDQAGCPNSTTPVIFSVGGAGYSKASYTPWPWLKTQSAAEAMAANVAKWDTLYGADGIDLDIENPAGNDPNAPANLLAFVKKLRELNPSFIITQPVYGFPQDDAENEIVNNGWTIDRKSTGLVDSIGIMDYQAENSLSYISYYANATSKNGDYPIKVNVATEQIIVGIAGSAPSGTITGMANSVVSPKYDAGGMMVWYASVFDKTRNKPAFAYGHGDASTDKSSAWLQALNILTKN